MFRNSFFFECLLRVRGPRPGVDEASYLRSAQCIQRTANLTNRRPSKDSDRGREMDGTGTPNGGLVREIPETFREI